MRTLVKPLVPLFLLAAACTAFGAGSGSMPSMPRAQAASPEDQARDAYNAGVHSVEKADALAADAARQTDARRQQKALDKANPNSRVGRIATYGKVVAAEDTLADPNASAEDKAAAQSLLDGLGLAGMTAEDAERASLEDAANKTVTDKVMDAVNDMLGL